VFLLAEVGGLTQGYRVTLPAGYFRLRTFDRMSIYQHLGIRPFKRLLRSRGYRRINPDFHLRNGRRGLADLEAMMQAAEAAHALLFLVVGAIAAGALLAGWFDAAAWLTLFNLLFNGYPVMLQRYNRLRLASLNRALAMSPRLCAVRCGERRRTLRVQSSAREER
jgi:Glycosyl-4,4'-diaponeurosporenoate acyltransferase